ncbi:MAG: DUF296 domain-containing protein [Laribacter sp.]|nr:DUF296 domain-containing protein [Laribacter sp.]MBP9526846.1 DUF296 domain-containing protein [Laribacter sp.]MBP9607735.1 DUF296 domain-containing protein [Laribacter sp.]
MLTSARFLAVRLLPGEELLATLDRTVCHHQLRAAWIAGAVGSLSVASLRFAGEPDTTVLTGAFEIIQLSGTLEPGGAHLHLAVSDRHGHMTGGHAMPGSIIRTTCELVIGALDGLAFARRPCPQSGYDELVIEAPAFSPSPTLTA